MSRFRDAFQAAAPSLDRAFGERLEIRRAAGGEFTRLPAVASDPPAIVVGILDLPNDVVRAKGENDAAKSDVLAQKPTAEFRDTLFAGVLAPPAQGDEIVALDRAGVPRFRVLDAKPDGVAHIVCQLAPL